MASPTEALDDMLDETESDAFSIKHKSTRRISSERSSLVRTLLRFLENVDDEMSVIEVRRELEELN